MKRYRLALWIIFMGMVACGSPNPRPFQQDDAQGVFDDRVIFGSSMALSGHAEYFGIQTQHGAMSYLNYINECGGVWGKKIEVRYYDDAYDPPTCLVNTQKLIVDDRVFALFCYVGAPTTVEIIPLALEARIPLVGMLTGANALRSPFNRYLINVRASYYQETEAAVRHLVQDLGLHKIAVFYQYDDYGFDGLTGTELALKRLGMTPVSRGFYLRGTMNVENGLKKIINSDAEAVVMIGIYDACAKFIKLAEDRGFRPIFYNISSVGADELARHLGKDSKSLVVISQVVPPPEEAPAADELSDHSITYAQLLKKSYPDDSPNSVGLEGFINAKVIVEGLRRSGRELTREKFIDAIESIADFPLGPEFNISFSRNDHQGSKRIFFTRLIDEKLIPIDDWNALKNEIRKTNVDY